MIGQKFAWLSGITRSLHSAYIPLGKKAPVGRTVQDRYGNCKDPYAANGLAERC